MKVSRCVKKYVEAGVEKMAIDRCRCQACVEEQTTISRTKARSIDLAIEQIGPLSIDPPGVEEVSRLR